jgi:hypothetical protein
MSHPIHHVVELAVTGSHALRLRFEDGLTREIDFADVLEGELFGPLRDPAVFAEARIDEEVHTVVWPTGADFDPATLHDWPEHAAAFAEAARGWSTDPAAG